jgi:hypothetical protein
MCVVVTKKIFPSSSIKMETNTAANRMYSLMVLYDMHTTFFIKALEDIKDRDRHNRLNSKANHIAWLAGSLVQERYELANALGVSMKSTVDELFRNHQGIKDEVAYPSLDVYKSDWESISPVLRNILVNMTDEKLDSHLDMGGEMMSFYDLICFIIYREANCIGQIALWRRLLGYEAMKYQ